MNIWQWIQKQYSKTKGFDGGLSRRGPWHVNYPDGKRTRGLQYGEAVTMQELNGGTLEYKEQTQ